MLNHKQFEEDVALLKVQGYKILAGNVGEYYLQDALTSDRSWWKIVPQPSNGLTMADNRALELI